MNTSQYTKHTHLHSDLKQVNLKSSTVKNFIDGSMSTLIFNNSLKGALLDRF